MLKSPTITVGITEIHASMNSCSNYEYNSDNLPDVLLVAGVDKRPINCSSTKTD